MIIIINDFENNFTLNFFKMIIFFESNETIDHINNKMYQLIDNKRQKLYNSNIKLNDTKDWEGITLSLNQTISKNGKQ